MGPGSEQLEEQLIKHLTDLHAIEEQALVQMRRAPQIAGPEMIAAVFQAHLEETTQHEDRIRKRLEAHGAEPSRLKDAAGKAGGIGMVWFARLNPDTPGKLVAHAYSYEHMELAAYELLSEVARRAGDEATIAVAAENGIEERAMAERLEGCFDAAVEASLAGVGPDQLDDQLDAYLADAHAIESQSLSLLKGGRRVAGEPGLEQLFDEHLAQTRDQEKRLREILEARGSKPSRLQDAAMHLGGMSLGGFFAAQPDTPAKLAGFAFAFEHLEIAGYELLRRVAERAEDAASADLARSITAEEEQMAERLRSRFSEAVEAALG